MSELIKCSVCNGTKKTIGFGFMEKTCEACKGVGFVERQDELSTEPVVVEQVVSPAVINNAVDVNKLDAVIAKRRGRPARKE